MIRKRIRLFHPRRKLWFLLAVLSLSLGMSFGEMRFSESTPQVHVATKLSRELQAFSLSPFQAPKVGVMRLNYQVSFFTSKEIALLKEDWHAAEDPVASSLVLPMKRVCTWQDTETETPTYSGEVLEVKMPEAIEPGEKFKIEVHVKNTGNRIWYSHLSDCDGRTAVNLGTKKTQDRLSGFFYPASDTGWIGANRVALLEDAVTPNGTATFAFTSRAPEQSGIYREYFGLVAEHVTWFEGLEFPVDIRVGDVTEDDEYKIKFIKDVSIGTPSLTGEAHIEVDLSEQRMQFKFGDKTVYQFSVSSGAWDTPTPTGSFSILSKQELRVGGKRPHYRMPYFQMFTKMGHGLHALPYLANDGGTFWSEALTHIGTPVSHGCIRVLPDDAVLVYEFTKIGTGLEIQR